MGRAPVVIAGATGRTGREVARAVAGAPDLELVGAVGHDHVGEDVGRLLGLPGLACRVSSSLQQTAIPGPAVLIDFTEPVSAFSRVLEAVRRGWDVVVGTTGFTVEQHDAICRAVVEAGVGAALMANFSIGAWVAEHLAAEAAKYFTSAEITEGHHAGKRDRPSGTARRVADRLASIWGRDPGGIPVHSLRLPGMVAHQTVLFGAAGQVLSIHHDVHDRSAYAPGVLAAVRKVGCARGRVLEDLGDVLEPL